MAALRELQSQYPGMEIHHDDSLGVGVQTTFQTERGRCLVMGHMMGCRGRASWDQTIVVGFWAGTKDETGRDLGDLGRSKCGK